jgi:hypothetical protein
MKFVKRPFLGCQDGRRRRLAAPSDRDAEAAVEVRGREVSFTSFITLHDLHGVVFAIR